MSRLCVSLLLAVHLVVLNSGPVRAADKEQVNLLRLPAAVMEATTAPKAEWPGLKALTDDNPATIGVATASPGAPLDVVYGFGDKTVSPEKLIIRLPVKAPPETSAAVRVELLVSTVSVHAGFQSLRADPLKQTSQPQSFSFPPTAARWIMLRFTPGQKATRVAVAEVTVLGHEGPPVTHYAFKETPAKAFDVLAKLKSSSSLNVTIAADEAALFQDVKEGRFQKWSFAEAALLESGVHDSDRRKAYLEKIDSLEKEARKVVGEAKSPFEKGEKLLQWLHQGPLAKGYESRQTDLSTILDTGKYNCVSSAVLFNVLARRLELDVRAIEVPEHAFAIIYQGTQHADVETTTSSGFNPARDPEAQKEFEKKTGFRYIADSHRDQRREIREAGLVAIMAYNHGVKLSEEKRYHEALMAYFRAMSLDQEFDSAVKNALAVLANWSVELSRAKKFQEAVGVLGVGLELAPKDATLLNNHKVVWSEWAEAVMKDGKDDEALTILRKAATAIPNEKRHFQAQQAWLYLRPGEAQVKAGAWEKALEAVEPGVAKLDGEPRKQLEDWKRGLFLRWGSDLLNKGRFENAVDVLEKGMKAEAKDKRILNNLVYTVQEWARDAYAKEGPGKAKDVLVSMQKRFPGIPELRDVAKNHVHRVVKDLMEAGKYEEALKVINQQDLIDDKKDIQNMSRSVMDSWAGKLTSAKKWEEAVGVYEKALKQQPNDGHLKNNLVYTIQEWARDVNAKDGPDKAKEVLLTVLKRFPKSAEVRNIAANHVRRLVNEIVRKGKYTEALAALDKNKDLLKDEKEAVGTSYFIYDYWADERVKKKDWQGAVDVYAKALERYPKDSHLTNNAVATWDSWARTYFNAQDWKAAIKVYEDGLKRFPKNGILKNNLDYCKEQMKK